MKLKTTTPVTIAQARTFEDEQGAKGIKKLNIFSQDDCHWEVEMGEYTLNQKFSAPVIWRQLQEYETGDPENPTGIIARPMFQETFALETAQVQQLWEAIGGQILSTDILIEKMDEFVLNGFIYWVTQVRGIFSQQFEVIDANRPMEVPGTEQDMVMNKSVVSKRKR